MIGTLHGEQSPHVIGCSTNYVRTHRQENDDQDCSTRRERLGAVFSYDYKIQHWRNENRLGNNPPTPQFSTDEEVMRILFKRWRWAVFRGHIEWERKKPMHWEPMCAK